MPAARRQPIPVATQAAVLIRDGWLCHLCRRPVILHQALKQLQELTNEAYPHLALAYWHPNWRRDAAPLLDELAASIDHVKARAKEGDHNPANFAAVCARCNARKSSRSVDEYLRESQPWRVKGKYGEPKEWDGLAALFVVLAKRTTRVLTTTERQWLAALEPYIEAGSKKNSTGRAV